MNALDGILKDLNKNDLDYIEKGLETFNANKKAVEKYFEACNEIITVFSRTGIMPSSIDSLENLDNFKTVDTITPTNSPAQSSIKENIEPSENEESVPESRPKRTASKVGAQKISQQINLPLNSKLRASKTVLKNTMQNAYVKVEKLSIGPEKTPGDPELSTIAEANVKTEVEEMPAPTRPAPRKKRQRGTSKVQLKQEKIEEKTRDSDVIVQAPVVPIINLDSSNDDEETPKVPEKKTTRTKKVKKRTRTSSSEDDDKQKDKRSKSAEEKDQDNTEFQDAMSTLAANPTSDATFVGHQASDATFVGNQANDATFDGTKGNDATFVAAGGEPPNMNSTVVVTSPKYVKNLVPQSVSDLMTDDESEEETKKKKAAPKGAIPKLIKPIFSPFDQSPVKKKVQAFEKLKAEADAMPPRVTRTKTRALAKEQEETDTAEPPEPKIKSNVKEKAKLFTPISSKFRPAVASTGAKPKAMNTSGSASESILSTKSSSALKASQAEYREREKRRREKEEEALKKREALIQAQIEEKKRRREEKQLKAQQQREILEKEKLKALEAQKLKDERHKQLMAEQEERKIKQKEELEKKRQLAKMKAIEEKKKEEQRRLEEEKKAKEMTAKLSKQDEEIARMLKNQKRAKQPVYLQIKPPFLPTEDCYDSDDERYTNKHSLPPLWAHEENVKFLQKVAFYVGEAIKNVFFSIQAQTPDLEDIFVVIEQQKLKRSSSAMWHERPRFTMIPGLENHDETEEFGEDSL